MLLMRESLNQHFVILSIPGVLPTPATATAALAAIPDCAKAAQSGSPGAGLR